MMTFAGVGVVTLPSPLLEDTVAPDLNVNFRQAMDATRYTTVQSSTRRNYVYDFRVDIQKLFELQQFIRDNIGLTFSITDHNDVARDVIFGTNPISFSDEEFGRIAADKRNELGAVTIEVTSV